MTAIVVIISYPEVEHFGNNFIMMTISAFSVILGDFAKYFLCVSVYCFSFATIICWAHYGIESVSYISKNKGVKNVFIIKHSQVLNLT